MHVNTSRSSSTVRSRRSFLAGVGLGVAAVGASTGLAGCAGAAPAPVPQGGEVSADVLPKYVPVEYAKPDVPSENGSLPGYTALPSDLVRASEKPVGTGRKITAMLPVWGTIPPASGNRYYEAVNEILGSTIDFQISDGNTYGDKIATVLASPRDVPDWVNIPDWNLPARFGSEIVGNVFTDLTPFLAGDAVTRYPNLANLPTDAWRMCVFNGKLYGLPLPTSTIRSTVFYRDDVLDELGITADVRSADDLLELAKEITDPGRQRWAAEDLLDGAMMIFGVTEWRLDDSGNLINRIETPEYRAALEWLAKLFAAGAVHPDAVAGNTEGAGQRFQSGRSLIRFTGLGFWNESLSATQESNPGFSMRPFEAFAGSGSGDPVLWKEPAAGQRSFIKQTDDKAKVEEILALADVLAAPIGTVEYQVINFGAEGVHYTVQGGSAEATPLAAKEITRTYEQLIQPPAIEANVQFPDFVKEKCEWMARSGRFIKEPLFYGMTISEPARYASIGQPIEDLNADIARGRKDLGALDAAIKTWKAAGGDALRQFYQEILDKQ